MVRSAARRSQRATAFVVAALLLLLLAAESTTAAAGAGNNSSEPLCDDVMPPPAAVIENPAASPANVSAAVAAAGAAEATAATQAAVWRRFGTALRDFAFDPAHLACPSGPWTTAVTKVHTELAAAPGATVAGVDYDHILLVDARCFSTELQSSSAALVRVDVSDGTTASIGRYLLVIRDVTLDAGIEVRTPGADPRESATVAFVGVHGARAGLAVLAATLGALPRVLVHGCTITAGGVHGTGYGLRVASPRSILQPVAVVDSTLRFTYTGDEPLGPGAEIAALRLEGIGTALIVANATVALRVDQAASATMQVASAVRLTSLSVPDGAVILHHATVLAHRTALASPATAAHLQLDRVSAVRLDAIEPVAATGSNLATYTAVQPWLPARGMAAVFVIGSNITALDDSNATAWVANMDTPTVAVDAVALFAVAAAGHAVHVVVSAGTTLTASSSIVSSGARSWKARALVVLDDAAADRFDLALHNCSITAVAATHTSRLDTGVHDAIALAHGVVFRGKVIVASRFDVFVVASNVSVQARASSRGAKPVARATADAITLLDRIVGPQAAVVVSSGTLSADCSATSVTDEDEGVVESSPSVMRFVAGFAASGQDASVAIVAEDTRVALRAAAAAEANKGGIQFIVVPQFLHVGGSVEPTAATPSPAPTLHSTGDLQVAVTACRVDVSADAEEAAAGIASAYSRALIAPTVLTLFADTTTTGRFSVAMDRSAINITLHVRLGSGSVGVSFLRALVFVLSAPAGAVIAAAAVACDMRRTAVAVNLHAASTTLRRVTDLRIDEQVLAIAGDVTTTAGGAAMSMLYTHVAARRVVSLHCTLATCQLQRGYLYVAVLRGVNVQRQGDITLTWRASSVVAVRDTAVRAADAMGGKAQVRGVVQLFQVISGNLLAASGGIRVDVRDLHVDVQSASEQVGTACEAQEPIGALRLHGEVRATLGVVFILVHNVSVNASVAANMTCSSVRSLDAEQSFVYTGSHGAGRDISVRLSHVTVVSRLRAVLGDGDGSAELSAARYVAQAGNLAVTNVLRYVVAHADITADTSFSGSASRGHQSHPGVPTITDLQALTPLAARAPVGVTILLSQCTTRYALHLTSDANQLTSWRAGAVLAYVDALQAQSGNVTFVVDACQLYSTIVARLATFFLKFNPAVDTSLVRVDSLGATVAANVRLTGCTVTVRYDINGSTSRDRSDTYTYDFPLHVGRVTSGKFESGAVLVELSDVAVAVDAALGLHVAVASGTAVVAKPSFLVGVVETDKAAGHVVLLAERVAVRARWWMELSGSFASIQHYAFRGFALDTLSLVDIPFAAATLLVADSTVDVAFDVATACNKMADSVTARAVAATTDTKIGVLALHVRNSSMRVALALAATVATTNTHTPSVAVHVGIVKARWLDKTPPATFFLEDVAVNASSRIAIDGEFDRIYSTLKQGAVALASPDATAAILVRASTIHLHADGTLVPASASTQYPAVAGVGVMDVRPDLVRMVDTTVMATVAVEGAPATSAALTSIMPEPQKDPDTTAAAPHRSQCNVAATPPIDDAWLPVAAAPCDTAAFDIATAPIVAREDAARGALQAAHEAAAADPFVLQALCRLPDPTAAPGPNPAPHSLTATRVLRTRTHTAVDGATAAATTAGGAPNATTGAATSVTPPPTPAPGVLTTTAAAPSRAPRTATHPQQQSHTLVLAQRPSLTMADDADARGLAPPPAPDTSDVVTVPVAVTASTSAGGVIAAAVGHPAAANKALLAQRAGSARLACLLAGVSSDAAAEAVEAPSTLDHLWSPAMGSGPAGIARHRGGAAVSLALVVALRCIATALAVGRNRPVPLLVVVLEQTAVSYVLPNIVYSSHLVASSLGVIDGVFVAALLFTVVLVAGGGYVCVRDDTAADDAGGSRGAGMPRLRAALLQFGAAVDPPDGSRAAHMHGPPALSPDATTAHADALAAVSQGATAATANAAWWHGWTPVARLWHRVCIFEDLGFSCLVGLLASWRWRGPVTCNLVLVLLLLVAAAQVAFVAVLKPYPLPVENVAFGGVAALLLGFGATLAASEWASSASTRSAADRAAALLEWALTVSAFAAATVVAVYVGWRKWCRRSHEAAAAAGEATSAPMEQALLQMPAVTEGVEAPTAVANPLGQA